MTLTGSTGALVLSLDYLTIEKQQKFEYGVLFLLSTLGMLMLISASDLIALYLGLELMSLPLYVIAASDRVVCILTGHQLKDPTATVAYHGTDQDNFEKVLGSRGVRRARRIRPSPGERPTRPPRR